MPTRIRQVLALEDGSAVILGADSEALLQIRQDGSIGSLDHPPAGYLLRAATRGSELWILGSDAVLSRRSNGTWKRAALSIRQLQPTGGAGVAWAVAEIVPFGSGNVALSRTLRDSSGEPVGQIVVMNSEMVIEQERTFARVIFSAGVADVSGTLWFLANVAPRPPGTSSGSLGYARFSAGQWTLWQIPGTSEWPLPGFELERASIPVFLESLAANPKGGAYGLWGGGLYEIDRDGEIKLLRLTSVPDGQHNFLDRAIDVSGSSGKLTILAEPYQVRGHLKLTRIDVHSGTVDTQQVPIPDWFANADVVPSLSDATLSLGPNRTWISAGPLLFAVQPGASTDVYSSPKVREQIAEVGTALALIEVRKWAALILSALLLLGAGAFGASRIHGEGFRATGLQALIGATVSLLPALALDAYSPGRGWGIGLAYGLNFLLFGAGFLATPLLSAFATWLSGNHLLPRAPIRAFAGALVGATMGTVLAVFLTIWILEHQRRLDYITLGLALGLISGAATLGYHAMSGKRRVEA